MGVSDHAVGRQAQLGGSLGFHGREAPGAGVSLDLADRANASAFEAEPTNAQILWDRAQALLQAGRAEGANEVFGQLADGEWQPRFGSLKSRARQYLDRNRLGPAEHREITTSAAIRPFPTLSVSCDWSVSSPTAAHCLQNWSG